MIRLEETDFPPKSRDLACHDRS